MDSGSPRRGVISGPLVLHDGHAARELHIRPWEVPRELPADRVDVVHHAARAILLVEKHTVFDRLVEAGFGLNSGCALMTGNGYPSRPFRAIARRIHDQLGVSFYVLADNDPAGIELFFLLARGSIRSARPQPGLSLPTARYLGLRAGDYERLGLTDSVSIGLNDSERQQLNRLGSCHWLRSNEFWQDEINSLKKRDFKVELEALFSLSASFPWDAYLRERLAAEDHLQLWH